MKVSGKNLLNVCKLIFKVSQDKENDKFFQKDNILRKNRLYSVCKPWNIVDPCLVLARMFVVYYVGVIDMYSGIFREAMASIWPKNPFLP